MGQAKLRVVFAAWLLVSLFSLPAHASYTVTNLKGSYSFLVNKWTSGTSDEDATLGVLAFDGVGGITGSYISVSGGAGTILSGSTYTVGPSGKGTMTLASTGGSAQADFVLNSVSNNVAGGLQLLAIGSGNSISAGSVTLISSFGSFGSANLKGTYSFATNGWTVTQSQSGVVGMLSFDGKGSVTFSYTQEVNGIVTNGTGSGTYTVNRDGSGSMTLNASGGNGSATFNLVVNSVTNSVAHGLQLLDAASTADKTNTGMAVRQ